LEACRPSYRRLIIISPRPSPDAYGKAPQRAGASTVDPCRQLALKPTPVMPKRIDGLWAITKNKG